MNKLTLVLLLLLPACVSQEQLAQSRELALARAESICQGRGIAPGNSDYLKCVQSIGKDRRYELVPEGEKLAFIVPPPDGIEGPIGGAPFYPKAYVPPVNFWGR
jgi:hypothetical protein